MKYPILLLLFAIMATSTVYAHNLVFQNKDAARRIVLFNNGFVDQNLADRDLLEEQLRNQNDDTSFHLFSHGQSGTLFLNNQWLSGDDLVAFIQPLLKGKTQLNIYGCQFAQGEKGRAAVEYLEGALGVSVAASNDVTGRDGDWDLEVGQAMTALNLAEYAHNLQCTAGSGEVAGTVWNDADFNGAMNEAPIVGVQDVEVNIYDCDGNLIQSMTTDANGTYTFSGLTDGEDYRVEFAIPISISATTQASVAGTDNGSTIQFLQPGNCADLGVYEAALDCDATTNTPPAVVTGLPLQPGMTVFSCFTSVGDGAQSSTNTQNLNNEVLAVFDTRDPVGRGAPFSSGWSAIQGTAAYHGPGTAWTGNSLGEIFGLALEEGATNPAIFATSFGIGGRWDMNHKTRPGGTGGDVWRIDGTTGLPTLLAELPNKIFTVGVSFERAIGLGQVSYNPDSDVLYVSNVYDGNIYVLDASTPNVQYQVFDHNPAAFNSDYFAPPDQMVFGVGYNKVLKRFYYYKNTSADDYLTAHVYSLPVNTDGTINTLATPKLEITFQINDLDVLTDPSGFMVSDIAFSEDGNRMLLGTMGIDLWFDPNRIFRLPHFAHPAELVRTSSNNWVLSNKSIKVGTFETETNGAGGVDYGYNNSGDNTDCSNTDDSYVISGEALVFSGEVNNNFYGIQISPIDAVPDFSTSSPPGNTYFIDIVGDGANVKFSLGDVEVYGINEVNAILPDTTQIGNYVWNDVDNDGIQDACEPALSGVTVELYSDAGVLLATTTTDANGQYYFWGDGTNDGATWLNPDGTANTVDDAVQQETSYIIVFGGGGQWEDTNSALQVGGGTFSITSNDANGNASDETDSDVDGANLTTALGSIPANHLQIPYTTLSNDVANHSLDVGFSCSVTLTIDSQTGISCEGESDGSINISSTDGTAPYEYSIDGGTTWQSSPITGLATGDYILQGRSVSTPNCISGTTFTIGCANEETVMMDVNIMGNANSNSTSDGDDPHFIIGPIEPANTTASDNTITGNSGRVGSNDQAILEFDEVLPVGFEVTVSISKDVTSSQAVISDGNPAGDFLFDEGSRDRLQHITFTITQATNQITVTGVSGAGKVWLDGAEYNGVVSKPFIVCTECSCPVTLTIDSQTGISCEGVTDGAITVSSTNGIAPYEYSIDGGTTWQSSPITGLATGDYTLEGRSVSDPQCISSSPFTIGCANEEPTVTTVTYIGDANASSTGGGDPGNLAGPILPAGTTEEGDNSSELEEEDIAVLMFDEVLPVGLEVTISITKLGSSSMAIISDGLTPLTFDSGNNEEIQHITYTITQATNQITVEVPTGTEDGVFLDGAAYNDNVDITTMTCADCTSCILSTDGLANVACGGTNAISLDLNPTGTLIGTMYNVSVNGGGASTISPTTANYGSATNFILNDNSAGGGDVTITITDATDGTCTRMVTVADPGACATTCTNPTITTRDTTICDGNMVDVSLLATTTGGTLTFHSATPPDGSNELASTTITPTTNTTIYVLATDGSCTSTESLMITHATPQSVTICDNASNSAIFTVQAGLTGVEWFNSSDVSVGTGDTVTIDANTAGMGDGSDSFYYTATDGSGCAIGICCPIEVQTEVCIVTYSLGNQVFSDDDNSGDLNGAEIGIDGVQLQLLNGADGSVYDSDPSTGGTQALTVTTASGGYYRFDDLPAGDYIVEVVANNFTATNILENLTSSTGTNQEADPDSDMDINDNGLDTQISGATRSAVVTLGTPEPTGETEPGSYGAGSTTGTAAVDTESNLTVDFGFYPLVEDYPDYSSAIRQCANEPCHTISNDLYLGQSVSPDANPILGEMADSDDDDGVFIGDNMQIIPGNTVRFPVTIYNNTGSLSYLRMWIDWNADGDFEDIGEQVENNTYPSTGAANVVLVSVMVPVNAIQTSPLALRTRLSTDDANSANPCGTGTCAADGEIEDYLIQLTCPTPICLPLLLTKKSGNP